LSFDQRLAALREAKMRQTREKQEVLRVMDQDDHGRIMPPKEMQDLT